MELLNTIRISNNPSRSTYLSPPPDLVPDGCRSLPCGTLDFLTSYCNMHVTMQLHLHPKTSLKLGQCWDRISPKSKIYYICSVALPPHLVPAAPLLPRHCCRPSCRICVASADRLCHRACSCLKPLACGLLPKHARRSRRRLCAAGCSTQADWAGGLRSRG